LPVSNISLEVLSTAVGLRAFVVGNPQLQTTVILNGSDNVANKLKRRAWSTADVRTLKSQAKKKTRAASIARSLKRTEGATRQKAFSLGLSLDSRA
jgi:hypothetical protein